MSAVICGEALVTVVAERNHSPELATLLKNITALGKRWLVLFSLFNGRPAFASFICCGSCGWDHMFQQCCWVPCRVWFHSEFLFAPFSRGIADWGCLDLSQEGKRKQYIILIQQLLSKYLLTRNPPLVLTILSQKRKFKLVYEPRYHLRFFKAHK